MRYCAYLYVEGCDRPSSTIWGEGSTRFQAIQALLAEGGNLLVRESRIEITIVREGDDDPMDWLC